MAVIKAVNSRASIGRAVKYVTKDEKTEDKLITGKDCDPFHAIEDMKATKELWGKTGGREYKHYVQSFAEGENITPELAHKCACEWAEKEFKGYECLIATHTDKGHIHSHVIVNSVNFENGEKFRQSKKWLENAKAYSDELCKKHGLSITEKGKTFDGQAREGMTAYSKDKYNLLEKAKVSKAKSYVLDTAKDVMDSRDVATSKADFIQKMAEKGYKTTWEDNKKNITFENAEGKKVRASNIEKTFKVELGKEKLETVFKENAERLKPDYVRDALKRKVEVADNKIATAKESLKYSKRKLAETQAKLDGLGWFSTKRKALTEELQRQQRLVDNKEHHVFDLESEKKLAERELREYVPKPSVWEKLKEKQAQREPEIKLEEREMEQNVMYEMKLPKPKAKKNSLNDLSEEQARKPVISPAMQKVLEETERANKGLDLEKGKSLGKEK